jgi:hypothetical protein
MAIGSVRTGDHVQTMGRQAVLPEVIASVFVSWWETAAAER